LRKTISSGQISVLAYAQKQSEKRTNAFFHLKNTGINFGKKKQDLITQMLLLWKTKRE
jgi:hypothetical protein